MAEHRHQQGDAEEPQCRRGFHAGDERRGLTDGKRRAERAEHQRAVDDGLRIAPRHHTGGDDGVQQLAVAAEFRSDALRKALRLRGPRLRRLRGENEKSYISVFSQYVDAYQNIKCYTKQGLDASSYLVSVYVEVKFKDVDTVAPGLDFFYVRTNEDGSVYIDNLYSQYNLKIKENALDTSIQNLISEYEDSEDVNILQKEVQGKYDTAIASDDKLSEMISTTIPNAITEWAGTIVSQNTETESTEQAPEETTESEQTETPEENTEQPAEDTPTQGEPDTVYAVDTVNVRAAADTESDKIGTLEKGTALTRTGTDGEWSVVNYNGQTGYIKTEYLTTKNSDSDSDNGGNEEQTTTSNFIAEGTVITLSDSINIRSGMSENDSKIGTAFSGEKVTVVMSYAEGWTKVTWNGQTGYIKTSLLQ